MLGRLLGIKKIVSPVMTRIVSPYFTEVSKMAEQHKELGPTVKAIRFPTEYVETISTMCDSVRNGLRCWKIPLITSFGLSKACR